jgi:hypothetical protein
MMAEIIDNFYRRLGGPVGLSNGSGTFSSFFLFPFYGRAETHFSTKIILLDYGVVLLYVVWVILHSIMPIMAG